MAEYKVDAIRRQVVAPDGQTIEVYFTGEANHWRALETVGNYEIAQEALKVWHDSLKAATDLLEVKGKTAYGQHWIVPLGNDIGVNPDTIRQWLRGKVPFTLDHPAWADINAAIAKQSPNRPIDPHVLGGTIMGAAQEGKDMPMVAKLFTESLNQKGWKIVKA